MARRKKFICPECGCNLGKGDGVVHLDINAWILGSYNLHTGEWDVDDIKEIPIRAEEVVNIHCPECGYEKIPREWVDLESCPIQTNLGVIYEPS